MAKRKTEFKISYYVACYHFLDKQQKEVIEISEEIEKTYFINIDYEIQWPKNTQRFGTQIDFFISSNTHTKLQLCKFAEILHQKIIGTSFGNFIEILNNQSSNYLSQIIFPNLGIIEIALRSIFKKVLISVFGQSWKKKIFDDNFESKRKENTLEGLTIEELYYIMFVNRRFLPILNEDELLKKSNTDLVDIIKNQKILTFWELFFPQIKLKEKICEIKKYRNIIMHFKGFKYSEYSDCKKLCTKIMPMLEKANNIFEMESMATLLAEEFKKINYSAIKTALIALAKEMNKIVTGVNNKDKP